METELGGHLLTLLPVVLVLGVAVAARFGEEGRDGVFGVLWSIADLWLPIGTLAWLLTFDAVGGASGALFGFGLLWYTGLFARIYHRPSGRAI